MPKAPAIGIDLGTTFSCVAVFNEDKFDVIPNEQGNHTTPSIVGFDDDDGILVGEAAKDQMGLHPEKSVLDAKRLIGRSWDDPVVQKYKNDWPCKLVNHKGYPKIEMEYQGKKESFSPEDISAKVLEKLKGYAEDWFRGMTVEDAVITVPAYFSNPQRAATRSAAKKAGLNVLSIINEPTAAAIAYGHTKGFTETHTILVYDLGGGTFDVSILKIVGNKYEVLATAGHDHLGGVDFDDSIVKHFTDDINKKEGKNISGDKKAISKLREKSEVAKRNISNAPSSTVRIDSLYDGKPFKGMITRGRFNEMNGKLFTQSMDPLRQVLEDAKMKAGDIDDVVLAGGSTRIPKIREMLDTFFSNKLPIASINPDEIVAQGAAIRAASYSTKSSNMARLKDFKLQDVNSLSLGIGARIGGVKDQMSVLIKRNTQLPATKTKSYFNIEDNQSAMRLPVYEGENPDVKNNTKIDQVTIDIDPAPEGETEVLVTFHLNSEGILKMTAKDKKTGTEKKLTMKLAQMGL